MTELKTLKDLKWNYGRDTTTVSVRDLKQEAIKWAKEFGYTENHNFCKFHNLTEDDLK